MGIPIAHFESFAEGRGWNAAFGGDQADGHDQFAESPTAVAAKMLVNEPSVYTSSRRVMRLSDFIVANREPILAEWEAFARTCTPASTSMDISALSDHATEMLTVIAADLKTPQGKREQSEKSKGNAPDVDVNEKTAAEKHGADRAESGFTTDQMVSVSRPARQRDPTLDKGARRDHTSRARRLDAIQRSHRPIPG